MASSKLLGGPWIKSKVALGQGVCQAPIASPLFSVLTGCWTKRAVVLAVQLSGPNVA